MAANNPNRRSMDLFNIDENSLENFDFNFREAMSNRDSVGRQALKPSSHHPDVLSIS